MGQAGIIRFKHKQSLLSLFIHYFYETQPQNEAKIELKKLSLVYLLLILQVLNIIIRLLHSQRAFYLSCLLEMISRNVACLMKYCIYLKHTLNSYGLLGCDKPRILISSLNGHLMTVCPQ